MLRHKANRSSEREKNVYACAQTGRTLRIFFAPVRAANEGRPVHSQSCIACFASEKIVLSMEQSIREKRASSGQISMRLPKQFLGLEKDDEPARHKETRR